MRDKKHIAQLGSKGFTLVELIIGAVIFPIIVAGIISAFVSLKNSYITARQLTEMYTVLSACPELDRALEFNALDSTTNCYPNNSFAAENGGTGTITYTPSLTVTNTSSLASGDPLKDIPDSKVIEITTPFPKPNQNFDPLKLRMLITRNGIGQQ